VNAIKTDHGYEPHEGYLKKALKTIPALFHEEIPDYEMKDYAPLLDSSNMTLFEWNTIAQDIADNYAKYDGFVILHGTDTMAYTASALSFMLENLAKPVILTGSQIPLCEVRNDAVDNIVTSLWLCAHAPIPEVCIYFNQKLFRGNRTQKISTSLFSAFDSPNFPPLASIGVEIKIQHEYILSAPKKPFHLQLLSNHAITNFRLFPGFCIRVLEHLFQQPIQGLVLETYGAGNAQNNDPKLLSLLTKACDSGLVIINCTQCQHGRVLMDQYATGYTLKKAGILSGFDMTPEATHCKLLYLFGKYNNIQTIRAHVETNLRGELTMPQ
jgi:L-asparaginase